MFVSGLMLLSACSDNKLSVNTDSSTPEQVQSPVDGKPINRVLAQEAYSGQSELLVSLQKELALKGEKSIKKLFQDLDAELASSNPSVPRVPLEELSTEDGETGTKSLGLPGFSSQLEIVEEDGRSTHYLLEIEPMVQSAAGVSMKRNKGSNLQGGAPTPTWLALDPDMFYVQDDENGEDIYPVEFPAFKVGEPDVTTTVRIYEDGRISFGEEGNTSKAWISTQSFGGGDLAFVGGTECDPMTAVIPCNDGGGTSGGGSGGNWAVPLTNVLQEYPNTVVENQKFFALKSINLGTDRKESGTAAETQMHLSPTGFFYGRKWAYAFDRKHGLNESGKFLKRFRDDVHNIGTGVIGVNFTFGSLASLISLDVNVVALELEILKRLGEVFAEGLIGAARDRGLFANTNRHNFGADGSVYEVPDIDLANYTYNFTNMKTWVPTVINDELNDELRNAIQSGNANRIRELTNYVSVPSTNYFPFIPIVGGLSFDFSLTEDDKDYAYYSRLNGFQAWASGTTRLTSRVFKMWDLVTQTWQDQLAYFDSSSQLTGSDDDVHFAGSGRRFSGLGNNLPVNTQFTLDYPETGMVIKVIVVNRKTLGGSVSNNPN